MAKLFVEKVVNGNAEIVSEWDNNVKGAMVSFHNTCMTLWNADDVQIARVKVLTETLDTFENHDEIISH